ncbi:MAG TPA: Gfo/Idh/MocA family oxidoreductase, partial [Anaerolineae bacterium]|nr:Gfo/Idh/MocA family oxidoreductase [Anaerolineae bacterium]
MRIGIMSFAHLHAEAYIQNLRAIPGVEMIGIADDDMARGKRFAAQFDARLFPSYESLLAEKPDGVLVCSENANHRPLVEMAAEAGVHVLSEKPLATSLADARAMVDACDRAGVMLMTAFPMRFSVPIVEMKSLLDGGRLGKVYGFNTTNQGQ